MDTTNTPLTDWVRLALNERPVRVSLNELERLSGVNAMTIFRIQHGRTRFPRAVDIERLAIALREILGARPVAFPPQITELQRQPESSATN